MTSAEGQVSLSDLRVESRTSMDATWSAHYIPIAPMPTRTRRESRHLNKERACCSCGMRSMLILPVMILPAVKPLGSLCCYPFPHSHLRSASDKAAAGPTMSMALGEMTGGSGRLCGQALTKDGSMAQANFCCYLGPASPRKEALAVQHAPLRASRRRNELQSHQ